MSQLNVIGCDPGAKGSICLLQLDGNNPAKIEFIDNSDPVKDIYDVLSGIQFNIPIRMAMIEDVHSIYGMSAKSNFSFGKNVGIIETLLLLQDFGLDKVQPKVWQKYAGVPTGTKGKAIKGVVGDICSKLYPNADIRGPKGGLMDGRTDALMIAHYCAHKYR